MSRRRALAAGFGRPRQRPSAATPSRTGRRPRPVNPRLPDGWQSARRPRRERPDGAGAVETGGPARLPASGARRAARCAAAGRRESTWSRWSSEPDGSPWRPSTTSSRHSTERRSRRGRYVATAVWSHPRDEDRRLRAPAERAARLGARRAATTARPSGRAAPSTPPRLRTSSDAPAPTSTSSARSSPPTGPAPLATRYRPVRRVAQRQRRRRPQLGAPVRPPTRSTTTEPRLSRAGVAWMPASSCGSSRRPASPAGPRAATRTPSAARRAWRAASRRITSRSAPTIGARSILLIDQQVGRGDAGAALARHLVATGDVDHEDLHVDQRPAERGGEVVAAALEQHARRGRSAPPARRWRRGSR